MRIDRYKGVNLDADPLDSNKWLITNDSGDVLDTIVTTVSNTFKFESRNLGHYDKPLTDVFHIYVDLALREHEEGRKDYWINQGKEIGYQQGLKEGKKIGGRLALQEVAEILNERI